jgi:hypothetical protein
MRSPAIDSSRSRPPPPAAPVRDEPPRSGTRFPAAAFFAPERFLEPAVFRDAARFRPAALRDAERFRAPVARALPFLLPLVLFRFDVLVPPRDGIRLLRESLLAARGAEANPLP